MWQLFLDLFFPRRSLSGAEGEWVTDEERRRLTAHPVIEDTDTLRRRGIRHVDRLFAASTYADCPLLRKAIHSFKYGRIPTLDRELGRLVACAAPVADSAAVLCPVPLHWIRRFQRGFNQAERLAQVIAAERGMSVVPLLTRIRWTGSQMQRTRADRLTAMDGAFRCTSGRPPSHVILIDDLSTTGATLDACALALKEAGAACVEGWAIAHDHRRGG